MIVYSEVEFDRLNGFTTGECGVFCYTYQCNIQCAHCLLSCSPQRNEKIKIEDAKQVLRNYAASGIRLAVLIGGEPFLNFTELSDMVSYASGLGMAVEVDSNGFWGKDYDKAKEKLRELIHRGLKIIFVSTDLYHQEFIPLAYPINVLRAAKELEIPSWSCLCPSSEPEKDKVMLDTLEKEDARIYILNRVPFGRSANQQIDSEISDCKWLGYHTMVNGDTIICGAAIDHNEDIIDTILFLGNLLEEGGEKLLLKKNLKCMEAFFNPESAIWYKKILQQAPYRKIFENKKFSHICELCIEMLHVKGISDQIMAHNP